MAEQFRVVTDQLGDFRFYVETVVTDFDTIKRFVNDEACNTSGFTGLLEVLHPAVRAVGDVYSGVLDVGRDRLKGTATGLMNTVSNYVQADEGNAAIIHEAGGGK